MIKAIKEVPYHNLLGMLACLEGRGGGSYLWLSQDVWFVQ